MKLIVPDYYKKFKCIAEKCQNSCCVGWEIDVDPDTLEKYLKILGKWHNKFIKSIDFDAEPPHFITDKQGRCPFLNKNGLCDIITELGEDALCQICYDHPRFRNYFSDRVEMGLGLCCEAAADLILGNKNKPVLVVLEEYDDETPVIDDEKIFFLERDALFSIFQNRNLTIKQKMEQAATLYSFTLPSGDILSLVKKYRALERLNPEWDEFLNKAEQKNQPSGLVFEKAEQKIPMPAEQLLSYFTYRYFAHEALLCNQKSTVKFILEATYFCLALTFAYYGELTTENFTNTCRLFSLEVEYSEDNIFSLLKGVF